MPGPVKDEEEQTVSISAASVKLPTFWTHRPRVWFVRIESAFRIKGIKTQQTMFDYTCQALPESVVDSVLHVIESPHADIPYDTLKDALIKRYAIHPIEQLTTFLNTPTSSDLDPRKLADQIKSLNKDQDNIEISLLLSKLPDHIQRHLFKDIDTFDDVHDLAIAAESLLGNRFHGASTSAVSTPNTPTRHRNQTSSKSKQICFYHTKFGKNARFCNPPCIFNDGTKPKGNTKKGFIKNVTHEANTNSENEELSS